MPNSITVFLYFVLCAFFGWILESTYKSLHEKKWINSGFLYGPFVPIYGFGALAVLMLDYFAQNTPLPIKLTLYFVTPTVIEYLTSFIFEKSVGLKLWDYSKQKFNLQGRICLRLSLIWFVLVLINIYFIKGFFIPIIQTIPKQLQEALSLAFISYFSFDFFFSIRLYQKVKEITEKLKHIEIAKDANLQEIFDKNKILLKVKGIFRPLTVFPNLMSYLQTNLQDRITTLKDSIKGKLEKKDNNLLTKEEEAYFSEIAEPILSHPEYQKLKTFSHHNDSIYEHSVKVAKLSLFIANRIKNVFPIHLNQLIRGALLHDFFLYDWRTQKPKSGKLHAFEHPKEAHQNSYKHFAPITKIEKDIIIKHMWPLNFIPPKYIETLIVVIADKVIASGEYMNKNNNDK